ncbi:MAG: semialdehyde dehydrogenase [Verrucomicrobia bacterium]|nr:semialdehyde dehydrogenase [Verrucomicrobiota bacterium]
MAGTGHVMTSIALLGAGGKMGCRITDHLLALDGYALHPVETGPLGLGELGRRGLIAVPMREAVAAADLVVLALPDRILGPVAGEVAPLMRPGAMVFMLDPAAAFAGAVPLRKDLAYFVSHPCHPSVFDAFPTQAEMDDFFGGTHARQAIVCSLIQGSEDDYRRGERLARDVYAPVTRSHRITLEQMALLEPTMAEVCGIALIQALREALEETVRRGVPREAAEDFMYGHIKVPLGIAFGRVGFQFSDGARLIAEYGRERLLRPDWKSVFEPQRVREQVRAIVTGELPTFG